ELGKHSSSTGLASLARSAMVDDYRSIRDLSLASLRKINDKNTAMYFVPGLRNENPHVRTRAANAISVFPNRAAVPELLTTMRMTWSGFGRAFTMQVTQRSYISDY
ncbi:MAG: HEAT repeat domain-containing protein, partial [Planctomycetes bacterium]|nr:HEAT repeat domain-containing protein [Planctomycetota bacterium]